MFCAIRRKQAVCQTVPVLLSLGNAVALQSPFFPCSYSRGEAKVICFQTEALLFPYEFHIFLPLLGSPAFPKLALYHFGLQKTYYIRPCFHEPKEVNPLKRIFASKKKMKSDNSMECGFCSKLFHRQHTPSSFWGSRAQHLTSCQRPELWTMSVGTWASFPLIFCLPQQDMS